MHAGLRTDLRSGAVAPWDRLTEKSIAAHFGVSRTPVRESLARLVAEGLLQRHPDGFGLVLPDPDTLGGLYEARLALELQGIRRVENGPAEHDTGTLRALVQEWEVIRDKPPAPSPGLVALDEDYHCRVLGAAGEPALVSVLETINDRIRALRMYGYIASDRLAAATEDHLRILALLLDGEHAEARKVLTAHITSSRHAALARALHGGPAPGFVRPSTPFAAAP